MNPHILERSLSSPFYTVLRSLLAVVSPIVKKGLSTFINKTIPHRQTQRPNSQLILDLVKLTLTLTITSTYCVFVFSINLFTLLSKNTE